jgi:hypothetical protein
MVGCGDKAPLRKPEATGSPPDAAARLSSWPVIAVSGALTVAFLLWFGLTDVQAPQGTPSFLQLQLAFTEERFDYVISSWSAAGTLTLQERNLWIDLLFPPVYGAFLAGLLGLTTRGSRGERNRSLAIILTLPFLAGALDWVENGSLLWLMAHFPEHPSGMVLFASTIAAIKWGLLLASITAIAYYLVRAAVVHIGSGDPA